MMLSFNRQRIGYALAVAPFVGLFIFAGVSIGWWTAIAIAVFACAVAAWAMLVAHLVL